MSGLKGGKKKKKKRNWNKITGTALGYFLASCFKFSCILTNPSIAQDSSVILLKELWASALIWYRSSINRASWRLYTPTRWKTEAHGEMRQCKCGGTIKKKKEHGQKGSRGEGKAGGGRWEGSQGRKGDVWLLSGQLVSQCKLIHPSLKPIVNFHSHAWDHLVIDWLTWGTLEINGSDTEVVGGGEGRGRGRKRRTDDL